MNTKAKLNLVKLQMGLTGLGGSIVFGAELAKHTIVSNTTVFLDKTHNLILNNFNISYVNTVIFDKVPSAVIAVGNGTVTKFVAIPENVTGTFDGLRMTAQYVPTFLFNQGAAIKIGVPLLQADQASNLTVIGEIIMGVTVGSMLTLLAKELYSNYKMKKAAQNELRR